MSEKKMVSRSVATALGIVCIVLAASLVGAIYALSMENANVQDLNAILNHKKVVTEIWLKNATFFLSPQGNVTQFFYTPYSGVVRVEATISPANPSLWVNLTWYTWRGNTPYLYGTSPSPDYLAWNNSYIDVQFLMASYFGNFSPALPNVGITIGNNSTDILTAVNVTITLYY